MAERARKSRAVEKADWLPPASFDVVQIPRAQWSAAYWDLDWPHLLALADVQQNGLRKVWKNVENPRAPLNTVWLREVRGRPFLYHQNWRD